MRRRLRKCEVKAWYLGEMGALVESFLTPGTRSILAREELDEIEKLQTDLLSRLQVVNPQHQHIASYKLAERFKQNPNQ